eukprot:11208841-Lingulodinium_polyedra.AAC.1
MNDLSGGSRVLGTQDTVGRVATLVPNARDTDQLRRGAAVSEKTEGSRRGAASAVEDIGQRYCRVPQGSAMEGPRL